MKFDFKYWQDVQEFVTFLTWSKEMGVSCPSKVEETCNSRVTQVEVKIMKILSCGSEVEI